MTNKKPRLWAIITTCAAVLFVAFFLCGCASTKIVPVVEYREKIEHDTIRVDALRVDSVYVAHYVREKGDTVHMIDTVYKWQIKEKLVDVIKEVQVTDSVPYPVEVEKIVRKRNGYDRFVSWGFWLLFVLLLLRLAWWLIKKYYLHR